MTNFRQLLYAKIHLSEDISITLVQEFLRKYPGEDHQEASGAEICDKFNLYEKPKIPLTGKKLAPIMKYLGYEVVRKDHQNYYSKVDLNPRPRAWC